jgi:hypothetical protein
VAGTKFTHVPPAAGDLAIETFRFSGTVDFVASIDGNVVQEIAQITRSDEKKETLIEEKHPGMKRVKVHYHILTETEGKETVHLPAEGKTYIITTKGDSIEITLESGDKPSPEEMEYLLEEYGDPDDGDPMGEFLNGRTVEIGETLSVPADVARDLFDDEALELKSMALTFKGERELHGRRCGVFDVVLQVRTVEPDSGLAFEIDATGEHVLTLECWPISLELDGTVTANGTLETGGGLMTLEGGGPMKISMLGEYR